MDKKYIKFGRAFEEKFLTQGKNENRTIDDTLNLGWELLGMLPKSELDRVSERLLKNIIVLWRTKKYNPERGNFRWQRR